MPYHKARDSKLDPFHNLDKGNIEKRMTVTYRILHSGVCIQFVKLWRAMRARKVDNNNVNTTVGPPLLPIKPLHKTPPLTNLKGDGVRNSDPPSGSALVSHGMYSP